MQMSVVRADGPVVGDLSSLPELVASFCLIFAVFVVGGLGLGFSCFIDQHHE